MCYLCWHLPARLLAQSPSGASFHLRAFKAFGDHMPSGGTTGGRRRQLVGVDGPQNLAFQRSQLRQQLHEAPGSGAARSRTPASLQHHGDYQPSLGLHTHEPPLWAALRTLPIDCKYSKKLHIVILSTIEHLVAAPVGVQLTNFYWERYAPACMQRQPCSPDRWLRGRGKCLPAV